MSRLLETKRRIQEIVDRETTGWDNRDVDLLLTVWHPDMVWPWPETPSSHDPMEWEFVLGRFDRNRWRESWSTFFASCTLVRNKRVTRKIVVSRELDGAFAVVDVDTLWRKHDGSEIHWKGRTCKVYSLVGADWRMIFQTGLLDYDEE